MIRKFGMTLITLAAFGAVGCKTICKQAQTDVMDPVKAATDLLETARSATDMASTCVALAPQLEHLSKGADEIRKVASQKFEHQYTTCSYWVTETRWEYNCNGGWGRHGRDGCYSYPYQYQYCAAYDYHDTYDPEYQNAMEASRKLDLFYAQAQQMCGAANTGQGDDAYAKAQVLLTSVSGDLQPQLTEVYARACQ